MDLVIIIQGNKWMIKNKEFFYVTASMKYANSSRSYLSIFMSYT